MVSAAVRSSFGQTLHQSDYMTVVADAFGNALGNRLARGPQPPSPAAQASVGLDTRYLLASDGPAGTGGMAYPEELWREIVGAAYEGPRIVDMERMTVRPDLELLQGNPYTAGVLESVRQANIRADRRRNAIDFSAFNDSNAVSTGPSPRSSVVSAGPAYQPTSVQREAVPLPSLLADDPVTLDTVVVDGSVLRKNPAIVNANLAAAQQAWDSLSLTDRLFDHYREGPSISRQLDLARADMREFNRWEDELPASTVINVLRNLDAYDAGKLDAPVGDVIRARGYIQMVNRYYMGDEPFVIGPPSQAEVAFATRNTVDLQLAMMGLSAMTAGHLTRWSGQSEKRVLMAGQSARAMVDIVTAAHIQSNGRAQPASTMASVRRPRAGGVANPTGEAHNATSFAKYKEMLSALEKANPLIDSLRTTGQLPGNFVTKQQAINAGWRPGKALDNYVPGGQLGGDVFQNTTGILPMAPGRIWYEADVGLSGTMSRANQPGTRLLYSNDGKVYITADHYNTVHPFGSYKYDR